AAPGEERFPPFRALRPVILSGWEMPVLLRAIVRGCSESAILRNWEGVRDEVVGSGRLRGEELVGVLKRTLDDVRREWIAAAPDAVVRGGPAGDPPARHHACGPRGRGTVPGDLGVQHPGDAGDGERERARPPARARSVPARPVGLALSPEPSGEGGHS